MELPIFCNKVINNNFVVQCIAWKFFFNNSSLSIDRNVVMMTKINFAYHSQCIMWTLLSSSAEYDIICTRIRIESGLLALRNPGWLTYSREYHLVAIIPLSTFVVSHQTWKYISVRLWQFWQPVTKLIQWHSRLNCLYFHGYWSKLCISFFNR